MVCAISQCRVGTGWHTYEGAPSDVESLKHMKKNLFFFIFFGGGKNMKKINVSDACHI